MSDTYLDKFSETGKLKLSGLEPIERIGFVNELYSLLPGGKEYLKSQSNPCFLFYIINNIFKKVELGIAHIDLENEFGIARDRMAKADISSLAMRDNLLRQIGYFAKKLIELFLESNDKIILQERLNYLQQEAEEIKRTLEM